MSGGRGVRGWHTIRKERHKYAAAPMQLTRSKRYARKMTMTIADTLNVHPLCEQIVHFLLENEHAMDTAKGIAAWWVRSDEIAVQAALDQLIACGVIAPYPFRSGVLYALTRDQRTRAWLRRWNGARGQQDSVQAPIGDVRFLPDHS